MNLDQVITFIVTAADSFGDDTVQTKYVTPVAVEQAASFTRGLNAELQTGELVAWIDPISIIWREHGLTMSGMLAMYLGTAYRVTGVRPGGSLLTGDEDLVELTLTKDAPDVQ